MKRFEMSRVENWRWALKEVAALKGPSLKDANRFEAHLVQNIIKEVKKMLPIRKFALPPNIIGFDSIVRDISTWIQDGSQDVGVGVIHGQGGVGKTTIAQIAFNDNFNDFDGSSFLEDIRRVSIQDNGLVRLQRKLILDISGCEVSEIYSVSEGMAKIRDVIGPKRILLVLDDVEEMEHLGVLFDHPEWFCPGSKIIITTRNRQLQKIRLFQRQFEVNTLNEEESTKLFSLLVFDQTIPSKGYEKVSYRFVKYSGGLPLALCVLGPLLRGEDDIKIWEDKLQKLENYPNQKIHAVLKLSFDSLADEDERNLFLHIAFFFVGRSKAFALKILKACDMYTKDGFQNLASRCLVSVSGGLFTMHHLIQEMGREVVRQESVNEPGLRSRLSNHKETLDVLRKNKGTPSIKGLRLVFPAPKTVALKEDSHTQHVGNGIGLASILPPIPLRRIMSNLESIDTVAFTNLDNLDLLELSYVQLMGGFYNFPKEIKWLWWQGCPLESIPQDLELYKLVVLGMQHSQLLNVWEDNKFLGALKILDLSHSCRLRSTPDLSNVVMLEWFILEGCINLVQIHDSIGSLGRLIYLNLKGCKNLWRLPNSIGKNLKRVDLSGCSRLFTELSRSRSQLLSSPFSSLNSFTSTVKLSLKNCGVSLDAILDSLSCLTSLEEMDLSYYSFTERRKEFLHFTSMYDMRLQGFKNLRSISQSPWINFEAGPYYLFPEIVEYEQDQYFDDELAETEGLLKLEAATKLDVSKDPELESFGRSTRLAFGGIYYGLWKGVCQCIIYSSFYGIDKTREYPFAVESSGSEIVDIVRWLPDNPIRAFKVCCVYQGLRYNNSIRGRLQVENSTKERAWLYFPEIYPVDPKCDQETEVSWVSYWRVMQHGDVEADDLLEVSFQSSGHIPVKCGMSILYEVDEKDVDDLMMKKRLS
ncbi:hypothetical protein QQ045_023268 [Rhodiola kirilowii]